LKKNQINIIRFKIERIEDTVESRKWLRKSNILKKSSLRS